jgi:hypothetical protein
MSRDTLETLLACSVALAVLAAMLILRSCEA